MCICVSATSSRLCALKRVSLIADLYISKRKAKFNSLSFLTKLHLQLKQLMEKDGTKQVLTNILAFKKRKVKKHMCDLNKNRTGSNQNPEKFPLKLIKF